MNTVRRTLHDLFNERERLPLRTPDGCDGPSYEKARRRTDPGINATEYPPLEQPLSSSATVAGGMRGRWSEWRDSNPRPLVPQTSALTGLRYTPTGALIAKHLPRCKRLSRSKGRLAQRAKNPLAFLDDGERLAQARAVVAAEHCTGDA